MNYKDIITILNDIEDNIPVEKIKHGDLSLWPLIRLEILKNLANNSPFTTKNVDAKLEIKISSSNTIKKYIKGFFHQTKYREADGLFLVSSTNRTQKIDGKYASPFSNSLMDFSKEMGIDVASLDISRRKLPVYDQTYFIDKEVPTSIYYLVKKIHRKLFGCRIENWDKLASYIKTHHPEVKLNKKDISNGIEGILFYQSLFEKILSKIKPKTCFLVCFYHPASFGFTRACYKLGIKTIEVQHGQQGDYHGMYSNWTKMPKEGYDTIPSHFWTWGQQSMDRINKWSVPAHPKHQAFVGGNPWMARFVHQKHTGELKAQSPKSKELDTLIPKDKINVLVALQPELEPLTKNLLETLQKSPKNINWLIRLHPRMLDRKDELTKIIQKTGNHNFEIDKSTSTPLFDLLTRIDFMITLWSSVAYDALPFKVRPIIIHSNGKATFEKYIAKGLFSYTDTSEEILNILQKDKSTFNFTEETPYIETSKDKIRVIMSDLLK